MSGREALPEDWEALPKGWEAPQKDKSCREVVERPSQRAGSGWESLLEGQEDVPEGQKWW